MGAPAEGSGGPSAGDDAPPGFDEGFRASLEALVRWRRDVRRFRADPVDEAALRRILELAGLAEAPVHLAVFCDAATGAGAGLGRATIPATLRDSVVGAVQALWLVARAHGLGVGWVSILRPERVAEILDAPPSWSLVAYLCIGHAHEEHQDPELVRHGWQERLPLDAVLRTL